MGVVFSFHGSSWRVLSFWGALIPRESGMSDILDELLEAGSTVTPPVLAIFGECGQSTKRRKAVKPQPRRGDLDATGAARWRIPVPDSAWDELSRMLAADPASWDGKRFRSIHGVPKQIFEELVEEARQHPELCGCLALFSPLV